jgi:hypothetical protein
MTAKEKRLKKKQQSREMATKKASAGNPVLNLLSRVPSDVEIMQGCVLTFLI